MTTAESVDFLQSLIEKTRNMTQYEWDVHSIISSIYNDEKRRLEKIEIFLGQTGFYKC